MYKQVCLGKRFHKVDIPTEWRIMSLEEVCNGKPQYGMNAPGIPYRPDYPRYVRITDIDDSGNLKEDDLATVESPLKEYELSDGDFLFARTGSVGRTFLYSEEKHGKCLFAGYLIRFRINRNIILPEFLFYYTHGPDYLRWLNSETTQGVQPNVNAQQYSSLYLPLPPLDEQRRITLILSKVDSLIQKIDEIVEQTQRLKKGLLHIFFIKGVDRKGSIRSEETHGFKNSPIGKIPEEWRVERLKDVSEKVSVGIATSTTKHFTDKGVPLLRNQNIKEGYIETNDLVYISEAFSKMNYSKRLKSGDVLCVRTGIPGQSAVVPPHMDGWHTFTTLIIRTSKDILYSHYLSWFLNSPWGRAQIKSIQGGGVQHNLNAGWLSNMQIPIPSIAEQQKIVDLLFNIENLINIKKKSHKQLEHLKNGLMQQLLTGKIRVKV